MDESGAGSAGRGRLVGGALVALALLVSLVLGTGASAGASVLRGPGTALPGTWLGSYATFAGTPWVWSVDAGRAAPEPGHPWSGRSVPAPTVAYLLAVHGDEDEPENHSALSYLVHTAPDLPHDAVAGMDLPARVQSLRDDAARAAGPYTVPTSMEVDTGERGARVVTAVLSAAGHPVAGRPLVARIEGPAEWEGGGGTVLEATSGAEPTSWRLGASGDGAVSVTVEALVPPVEVTLHDPGRAGVQRVVSARQPVSVAGSASAQVRHTFAPRVTTRTSEAVTAPGAVLTDLLEVGTRDGTAWPEGAPVEVVSTLWGPFDERPAEGDVPPQGAPVVGTVVTQVDGPGSTQTPGIELLAAGYYVWTEEIVADERQTGWTGRFGLADATTLARWQPVVQTHVPAVTPIPPTPPGLDAPPVVDAPPVRARPALSSSVPAVPAVPAVVASSRPAAELPRTGTDSTVATAAGAGLLVLGGVLVVAGRARRTGGRHCAGLPPTPPVPPGPRPGWVPARPTGAGAWAQGRVRASQGRCAGARRARAPRPSGGTA